MQKAKVNFLIDISALVCIIILAITGFILYFIIPRGTQKREIFFLVHSYTALVFAILIAIHFYLHLKWFWGMVRKG